MRQLEDAQFHHIHGCLSRALDEIQKAYAILYGTGDIKVTLGAAELKPNDKAGEIAPIAPPKVTKNHKSAINNLDPEKQEARAINEIIAAEDLQATVSKRVLVRCAVVDNGSYYAMVRDEATMQEAAITITKQDYLDLKDVKESDGTMLELSKECIEAAEWEPIRQEGEHGTCNCGGQVPQANPRKNLNIAAEILSGHRRTCTFWDNNTLTITADQKDIEVRPITEVDASARDGFKLFVETSDKLLREKLKTLEKSGKK